MNDEDGYEDAEDRDRDVAENKVTLRGLVTPCGHKELGQHGLR